MDRRLFQFRHESRLRYIARRVAEELGPYLFGAAMGIVMACFLFWGV